MVEEINKTQYICPNCYHEYNCIEDAEECLLGHSDVCEKLLTIYKCEMCLDEFKRRVQAQCCEEVHKKFQDKHYLTYVMRKNFEKLQEAGNHPLQVKLSFNFK